MALLFWAKNPQLLAARLKYWVWERQNPDKPWMCPGTIAFCEKALSKSMTALEFGSGRSTRWFAGLVGHVTSVEHDGAWYSEVQGQISASGLNNVKYLHVPLEHPPSAPERSNYDTLPRYVGVVDRFADRSLDFIVVDGHYRTTCIRHAMRKLAPGGYLLVDDINMWATFAEVGVPADWPIVDDSTNGIKRCVIWQAV
jgi:Methyltransferase domain